MTSVPASGVAVSQQHQLPDPNISGQTPAESSSSMSNSLPPPYNPQPVAPPPAPAPPRPSSWLPWIVAAIAVLIAGGAVTLAVLGGTENENAVAPSTTSTAAPTTTTRPPNTVPPTTQATTTTHPFDDPAFVAAERQAAKDTFYESLGDDIFLESCDVARIGGGVPWARFLLEKIRDRFYDDRHYLIWLEATAEAIVERCGP